MSRSSVPPTRTRRSAVLAPAALALALALTGCSSPADGSASADGKITLTVGTFGTFGYKEAGLYDAYMEQHPEIVIKENPTTVEGNYWTALQTRLSGGGLDDVQALEVGRISLATSGDLADAFADLSDAPGVEKENYLPWKWEQATTEDGRTIGLGTDVGPMAICYRQDLFKAAGLPSDPEAVGRLWAGDWAKFVETGKRYQAKAPAAPTSWTAPPGSSTPSSPAAPSSTTRTASSPTRNRPVSGPPGTWPSRPSRGRPARA